MAYLKAQSQPKVKSKTEALYPQSRKGRHEENPRNVKAWEKVFSVARTVLTMLIVLTIGLGGGFLLGLKYGKDACLASEARRKAAATVLISEIYPVGGTRIPAQLGNSAEELVAVGAIDSNLFADLYKQAGSPLSEEQKSIFQKASTENLVFTQNNGYFYLNLLWGLGLTNRNSELTDGPMAENGLDQIGNYASTSRWTLGAKPASELFASQTIIRLTKEQQDRLEDAVGGIFRPCCNNPTSFPDCNHGMAMLGLMELLASQNATTEQMFEAAKTANATWFPEQTYLLATYFKANEGLTFDKIDARALMGEKYSSGSGIQQVQEWLLDNGLMTPDQGGGSGCGL